MPPKTILYCSAVFLFFTTFTDFLFTSLWTNAQWKIIKFCLLRVESVSDKLLPTGFLHGCVGVDLEHLQRNKPRHVQIITSSISKKKLFRFKVELVEIPCERFFSSAS